MIRNIYSLSKLDHFIITKKVSTILKRSSLPEIVNEFTSKKFLTNCFCFGMRKKYVSSSICQVFAKHLSKCWAPPLLVEKHLANSHLADRNLSDSHWSGRHLADEHLADGHLADRHLAVRQLVRGIRPTGIWMIGIWLMGIRLMGIG